MSGFVKFDRNVVPSRFHDARYRDDLFYIPGLKNLEQVLPVGEKTYENGTFNNANIALVGETGNDNSASNNILVVDNPENGDSRYFNRLVTIGIGNINSRPYDTSSECFELYVMLVRLFDVIFENKILHKTRGYSINIDDTIVFSENEPVRAIKKRKNDRNIAIRALYSRYEEVVSSGDENDYQEFVSLAILVLLNLSKRPFIAKSFATGIIPLSDKYVSGVFDILVNLFKNVYHIEAYNVGLLLFASNVFDADIVSSAHFNSFSFLDGYSDESIFKVISGVNYAFDILGEYSVDHGLSKKNLCRDAVPYLGAIDHRVTSDNIHGLIAEVWMREYLGNRFGQSYRKNNVHDMSVPKEIVDFLYSRDVIALFESNDEIMSALINICCEIGAEDALSFLKDDNGNYVSPNQGACLLGLLNLFNPIIVYYANKHFNLGIDNSIFVNHFNPAIRSIYHSYVDKNRMDFINTVLRNLIYFLNDKDKLSRYLVSWYVIQDYLWDKNYVDDMRDLGDVFNHYNDATHYVIKNFINSIISDDDNIHLLVNGLVTPGHYYKIVVHQLVKNDLELTI